MPTVREIAKLAGVSKSTVSLVLNDKAGVSEEKRQAVLTAQEQLVALEHEKQPIQQDAMLPSREHAFTRGQVAMDNVSILVLHPPVLEESHVFSEVLQGIQSAAETYQAQLSLAPNTPDATGQHVSRLYFTEPYLRPNGVLLFGAQQYEPVLIEIERLGLPCVVLGRDADKYDVSGLGRDEYRYAYSAASYLISLGHQAIGFVGGESVYDYVHNRVSGYKQALEDNNLSFSDNWVQFGDGAAATSQLLDLAGELTSVIYVNDSCAEMGLPIMRSAGIDIPRDMSVVSFDDTDFAKNYTPPLTSVSYRRYEEGQWAVKMLMDQIRYAYVERVQVIFRANLIKRGSCAPPVRE